MQGKITWRSPSNIALVKYWGKYDTQIPANPSISFTLKNAYTDTHIQWGKKQSNAPSISFQFEGKTNPMFENRIQKYIASITDYLPVLNEVDIRISSSNSFPHSTGIASSASAMSALALCLCSMEQEQEQEQDTAFFQKASFLSRLGSGSACRSVYPTLSVWGKHPDIKNSSDEYAIPVYDSVHPVFHTFQNAILIVSSSKKEVSSSAGHSLMFSHPFSSARFEQARKHLSDIWLTMKSGDLSQFIDIVEAEALTLHALMMSSSPSYMLMHPNTISIIKEIRQYRKETNIPLCFTLDAGPNIHLLYPSEMKRKVQTFIDEQLVSYCENGHILYDEVGSGPKKL